MYEVLITQPIKFNGYHNDDAMMGRWISLPFPPYDGLTIVDDEGEVTLDSNVDHRLRTTIIYSVDTGNFKISSYAIPTDRDGYAGDMDRFLEEVESFLDSGWVILGFNWWSWI